MHDVAWAAGFFEGEGTANVGKSYFKDKQYLCLRMSLSQVYREPLDKFAEVLGGTVRGPYGPYSGNRQAHWQWNASGQEALEIANKLMPYLFAKGVQLENAMKEYEEYWNDRKAA